MKKLIAILIIGTVSFSVTAQKRNELQGPAYKNYKPWKHDTQPVTVYSVNKKEILTGPKRKNQKAWDKSVVASYTPISFGSERAKLQGPAYKNYKPWRKDSEKK